jgi:pimeloyl-ACP methyl ester carboxylesterase
MTAPPVLLVHGFASHFEHDWRRTGWVDILEADGRTVRPVDLPGHGRAAQDPSGCAPADAVDAAAGAGPVDAVGFSAGGRALLAAAARRPAAFRRLAVLAVGSVSGDRSRAGALACALEADDEPRHPTDRLLRRLADNAGNDRRTLARVLRSRAEAPPIEQLSRLQMPILLIVGDRDFTGSGRDLAELLPTARRLVLDGVDHFRTLTDLRCMNAVLEFLAA